MSTSLISRLCAKFREGIVRVCVTIGTALIAISVAAVLLPLVLGALLLALAQRTARQNEDELASIVVLPAATA